MIDEVVGRNVVTSIDVVLGDEFAPGIVLVAKWIKNKYNIIIIIIIIIIINQRKKELIC